MAINVLELLSLPCEERLRLAEILMESAVPPDIGPLLRELVQRTERTNRSLDELLDRLSRMDETLERNRAEVREQVRRSGEVWPFPLPEE